MPILESCPHCGANVLFNGTICPNCSLDRNKPDASKLEQLRSSQAHVEKAARRPAMVWWKPIVILWFFVMLAALLYQPNVFTLLFAGIGVVTGFLAMRKGYDFFLWALASGAVGLIILAFLPFANKPSQSPEECAALRHRGHMIATVLLLIGFALQAYRIISLIGAKSVRW